MYNRKNIIIILTDDQGYGDVHCHGNRLINTPNMDFMYNNGISLEDFHTDPMCAPTRASLLSGKYSFGVGVFSTLNGRYYMDTSAVTIADCFKLAGYETGMFGKWHLGDIPPYSPNQRGFNSVLSFGGGVVGETPDYWNNRYLNDTYIKNGVNVKCNGYCTDIWFNAAIDFINSCVGMGNPFLCYIAPNAPHTPLNISPQYYEKYIRMGIEDERARFYGMIECIDENIGKLFNYLNIHNLLQNTIIVFMGDNGTWNGCELDEDDYVINGYNAGMRGRKSSVYEGAHRNSCFIMAPSNFLGESRRVYGLTSIMDIFPTLADACMIEKPKDLDGLSLYQELKLGSNDINKGRTLVIHQMQLDMPQKFKDYTVLRDNLRLVMPSTKRRRKENINSNSKFIEPEVYDIKEDPEEKQDCYLIYKEIATELKNYYEDWYDERVEKATRFKPAFLLHNSSIKLTCHAWHDCEVMCYNQKHIRLGVDGSGFFSLNVVQDGRYTFELRRYPREANINLCDSVSKEAKSDFYAEELPMGKAYDIVSAEIQIGEIRRKQVVGKNAKCSIFHIDIKAGVFILRARFNLRSNGSIGVYYIYIQAE